MDAATFQFQTGRVSGSPRIAFDHAGAGPLVVLMHGIGGNKGNWRAQMPVFAAHFHVVAWDARGYGQSEDYEGPLSYKDFCDDLVRLIDYFGAARAHLVGLSMGGTIAQDFHAFYPERVASLVLVDTRPAFEPPPDAKAREEFLRLRLKPLQDGKEPRDMAPAVARSLMGPKAGEDVYRMLVESMETLHKASYMKTIAARQDWIPVFDPAKVAVPTLVVVGAEDRLTPPVLSERIVAAIAGARLATIPDAGHLSNIEQPETFNRIVLQFLRSIE